MTEPDPNLATSGKGDAAPAAPPGPSPPVYSSEELLAGGREFWIKHGEQYYRVRLTSANKLYLCK